MSKVLKIILFIFFISMLLPNCYVMAEHDWNSQGRQNLQEKGNTQEELKTPEEWKGLEQWKAREAQKRVEQWKVREAQRRLDQWKVREAQKRLEEWKAREERKKLEEWKIRNGWKGERYPYGHYYPGPRQGKYGERKIVRTDVEARNVLQQYFSQQKVTIGQIKGRNGFFEAEIKDRNNIIVDRVIIDKRTGRIRSIY
jgi:hypothetical protein